MSLVFSHKNKVNVVFLVSLDTTSDDAHSIRLENEQVSRTS